MKKECEFNVPIFKKCLKEAYKDRVETFGVDGYLYVNAGKFGVRTNNPEIKQIIVDTLNIRLDFMTTGVSVNSKEVRYEAPALNELFDKYKMAATKKAFRTKWTIELVSANFRMFCFEDDGFVMVNSDYDSIINHRFNLTDSPEWRWHILGSDCVSPICYSITTALAPFTETDIFICPCRVSGDVIEELLAVRKSLTNRTH